MKKLKLLPSMLMLIVCVAVLCVGVFSLTPTENTIGGTINISSMARVKLSCYVDEEVVYDSQNTAYGVDWDLTDTALNFNVSNYAAAEEVPLRTIRIHIQNLTSLHLGAYFYNGDETTLQTINGEKYATYDSLKLSDAVYRAGQEGNSDEKFADITLSSYGYIAPANADNTYDEHDMFINIDITKLDVTEVSNVVSYMLRIEEYQSNVTIDGSNVATFTPLANKTKQLVNLPTNNTNTTVPTFSDTTIGYIAIPTTYTSIPASGFTNCTGLTAISISQSITSVGNSALSGCLSLNTLELHSSKMISSIHNALPATIKNINVSSFVSKFPSYMFMNVSDLKTVVIANSKINMGSSAFRWCSNIENVNFVCSGGTEGVDEYLFENGKLTIKSMPDETTNPSWYKANINELVLSVNFDCSPTVISTRSFYSCHNLKSIKIPSQVSAIGNYAFKDAYINKVQYVTSGGTEGTDKYAFENGKLTIYSMPEYTVKPAWYTDNINPLVTEVEWQCSPSDIAMMSFYESHSLKNITIPSDVKNIGSCAFGDCRALEEIEIPDGVTDIYYGTFMGCINLTEIVMPDDTNLSGEGIFQDCKSLTDIFIPSSETSIPKNTFNGCSSLKNITIPNNILVIHDWAFNFCRGLETVIITSGTQAINASFNGCTNLKSIYIPSSVAINSTSEDFTFDGCSTSLVIYTDATTAPSNWHTKWNYTNYDGGEVTVKYEYSLERYKAEVGLK